MLWRSVYLSNDRFHVDAIRVAPGGERIYPGGTAAAYSVARDLPSLTGDTMLAHDIERFIRLSDGFVAPDPARQGVLIDIRYSMLPTSVEPMWGLDTNVAAATRHARFEFYRDRPDNMRAAFIAMLLGRDLPE